MSKTAVQFDKDSQRDACANQLESCRKSICGTCSDVNLGEELYQEVCLRCSRVMTARNWLEPQYGFIHAVSRRALIDLHRRAIAREKVLSASAVIAEAISPNQEAINAAVNRESKELIRDRLARLPVLQRNAIEARYLQNHSTTEIAKKLDVSVHTVKTRIYRGLVTLRDDPVLQDYFSESFSMCH